MKRRDRLLLEAPSPNPLLDSDARVKRRFCFLINFFYFLILIVIAALVLRYLFAWMLPFVLAFIVAATLQRPLRWLVKKTKISKKFFSVVLVILLVLFIAGIVGIIGWQLVIGTVNFFNDEGNLQLIKSTLTDVTNSINSWIVNLSNMLSPDAMASVQNSVSNSASSIIDFFTTFFKGSLQFITTKLPAMLVSFIIWVIASIFLTIDYQRVINFFLRQVPKRHTELVNTIRDLCTNTIFKLIKAYALLMFITFMELSIGLTILNIPYSILIAAMIAVVDILPVLGTGTIVIPWAFIELIMGNVHLFIGLSIMYIIITIIRNILEPRLVSQQIGLNPLVTLFFMFLGLKSIGIFGMLLFPVTIMILKQLQDSGKIKIWK